jgi:hypothetical protein
VQRHGRLVVATAIAFGAARGLAHAHSERPWVDLVVETGTPLRIALLDRVKLKKAGQVVTGQLVEDVYAYDRIVIPAGTRALGRVAGLEKVTGRARTNAVLGGDLTPLKRAVLQFDTLVLGDGREIPVETEVRSAGQHLVLSTQEPPRRNPAQQAADQVTQQARRAVVEVKKPGKLSRLAHWLVMCLPFHPQYLEAGTVFTAVLQSDLAFGTAEPAAPAAAGSLPAPESVLHARLLTPLDSSKTPRGTLVRAVVTRPVFSEDQRLILPEGAVLKGEVTFARKARWLKRNGQLRFLFETVQAPERRPETLQASLRSIQADRDQRIALDEEGGAAVVSSRTRFIAPALASLALAGTLNQHLDYDTDGLGPETQYGSFGSVSVGGFFGWSLMGVLLSQLSHPAAVAFAVIGVARTVFSSLFARGRDVSFAADTVMEVQLPAAPCPSPSSSSSP